LAQLLFQLADKLIRLMGSGEKSGQWATSPFLERECPLAPLFNILDLFAEFFDLDFSFDGGLADANAEFIETGSFGEDGGDLAVHFLEDEVHSLARFVLKGFQAGKLVEMTAEPGGFFGNVTAFSIKQCFSFQAVATVGGKLRREFRDTGHQLLPIMFHEVSGTREDRFQVPSNIGNSPINIVHQRLPFGKPHLFDLRHSRVRRLAKLLAD